MHSFGIQPLSQDTLLVAPPHNRTKDRRISLYQVIYYCHESISQYGTEYLEMVIDDQSLRNSAFIQQFFVVFYLQIQEWPLLFGWICNSQAEGLYFTIRCISKIVLDSGIAIYHLHFRFVWRNRHANNLSDSPFYALSMKWRRKVFVN